MNIKLPIILILYSVINAMGSEYKCRKDNNSLYSQTLKYLTSKKFFDAQQGNLESLASLSVDDDLIKKVKYPFMPSDGGYLADKLDKNKTAKLHGHKDYAQSVALSHNGLVISGSQDKTIRLWDVQKGRTAQVFKGHEIWVNAVAAGPNDSIISGSSDATVRLWDEQKGKEIRILSGNKFGVNSVVLLPTGLIASGSYDGTVFFWDPRQNEAVEKISENKKKLTSLVVRENEIIILYQNDAALRLWDIRNNKESRTMQAPEPMQSITASPDGSIMAVTGCRINIWDKDSDTITSTIDASYLITAMAVDKRGTIVTGLRNGWIQKFNKSSQKFENLWYRTGSPTSLVVSPDGMIVSGGCDKTVYVADLTLFEKIEAATWPELLQLITAEPRFKSIEDDSNA